MTSSVTAEVEPLTRHLGVRVHGVSPLQIHPEQLRDLVQRHSVVIFGAVDLDDEGQMELVSRLGMPYLHPFERVQGVPSPEVWHFVDDAERRPDRDSWHTDESFAADPPSLATLRCIEPAAEGGDTLWSSMYAAAEALSEGMREFLSQLNAWHSGPWTKGPVDQENAFAVNLADQFPGAAHNVIGHHPYTHQPYLYVNRGLTSHILELTDPESSALLGFLFAQAESPNWQYRHRWARGDVAIWDERSTQHFAASDHYPQRREMARLLVA